MTTRLISNKPDFYCFTLSSDISWELAHGAQYLFHSWRRLRCVGPRKVCVTLSGQLTHCGDISSADYQTHSFYHFSLLSIILLKVSINLSKKITDNKYVYILPFLANYDYFFV